MRRILLSIMLVLFVLEGSIWPWLMPESWLTHVRVAPHFVFVIILYIAIYMNRYYSLMFGMLFGLLHDLIYYGHMIGTYTFSMGLVGYTAGLLIRKGQAGFVQTLLSCVFFTCVLDSFIYALYRLFGMVQADYSWAFMHHILPSLFINGLFTLVVYIPMRKLLERANFVRKEEESA